VLEWLKFIQEHWKQLKRAPWTYWGFIVLCVSAFCMGEYWLLDKRMYAPLRDTATIQNERLNEKDNELKFLQRQLDKKSLNLKLLRRS
jgi:hypothetical protein